MDEVNVYLDEVVVDGGLSSAPHQVERALAKSLAQQGIGLSRWQRTLIAEVVVGSLTAKVAAEPGQQD